jgi:hypothetical protein
MLHDNYGAFAEMGIITSYASRIQVTNRASIRMGIGVNYNTIRLDGHRMTTEQADDEILANYLNGFATTQILNLFKVQRFNSGLFIFNDLMNIRNLMKSSMVRTSHTGMPRWLSGCEIPRSPRILRIEFPELSSPKRVRGRQGQAIPT